MNKFLIPVFLVVLFAAQWFVPAQMIYQQETVLTSGTQYKFKTTPIDPNDPLRGKYIRLNYEMNKVTTTGLNIKQGDAVYVYIDTDENGFATATHVSKELEETRQDYVLVEVTSIWGGSIHFELPFSVFYMEESKALEAEVYVREASRDSLLNCYGLVYIKDDVAVLKDVIVDNISIKDYVLKHRQDEKTPN